MVLPTRKYYTPQEYLALEEIAAYKSEYYKGEVAPMAMGMVRHNTVCANTIGAFVMALKGSGYRTLSSNQRLYIEAHEMYIYPDASVLCGSPQFAQDDPNSIVNPTVIIEVTSKHSFNYDHTAKFSYYRTLASLQAYLLVVSDYPFVSIYQRLRPGSGFTMVITHPETVLE